jgi:hypothetical protein
VPGTPGTSVYLGPRLLALLPLLCVNGAVVLWACAAVDGARRPGAVGLDTGPARRTYRISAAGLRRLARLDAAAGELQRPSSVGAVARPPGPLRQASRDIYQRF